MLVKNLNQYSDSILEFLESLKKQDSKYSYNISSSENLTSTGAKLELGFSCYALKLRHMFNDQSLDDNNIFEWFNYISSFQKNIQGFPSNSFVDDYFLLKHKKFNAEKSIKNFAKTILNKTKGTNYLLSNEILSTSIVAETKQAISTLSEIGYRNKSNYSEFPKDKKDIFDYLNNFDWNNPWSAGAQFSSLCLFAKTQISDNSKTIDYLNEFIKTKLDTNSGFYFTGEKVPENVLINGAMKVITGLDWIESEIHYPEKIIDYILNIEVSSEACDLVDLVYCLYMCSKLTNYRKLDITNFLYTVEDSIFKNYKPSEGGFSYSQNKSQKYYYGLIVTKEMNFADLHGTLLLSWAYTLILDMLEKNEHGWKIIKP